MSRKEPKLRPSNSWSELELMCKAADHYIQHCISTQQVTLETLKLAEVKQYFESFKPAQPVDSALAQLLKNYNAAPVDTTQSVVATESSAEVSTATITIGEVIQSVSPLDMPDLTNEQKYDMIKLRPESSYTDAENAFILNTGTMIMMKRASIKPVNAGDL